MRFWRISNILFAKTCLRLKCPNLCMYVRNTAFNHRNLDFYAFNAQRRCLSNWGVFYQARQTLLISWGPFLTSPLGANFDPKGKVVPRGEFCPPGGKVKFSVRPSILPNKRQCEHSPLGQISSLGARGEVKNGPKPFLHIVLSKGTKVMHSQTETSQRIQQQASDI
jgi:hypothetical protein